jgi:hypothetical protein
MAKTFQERYLAALQGRGEQEVKRLTGCIVVSRKAGGFYYLGTSGSLRYGQTRAGSLSCGTKFKTTLLEEVTR